VSFDTAGLAHGRYWGTLVVESNDPDTPQVDVPVSLSVPDPAHRPGLCLGSACAIRGRSGHLPGRRRRQ